MSTPAGSRSGLEALAALLSAGASFRQVSDDEYVRILEDLAGKILKAGKTTGVELKILQSAIGDTRLDQALDRLTPKQVTDLARRLDKRSKAMQFADKDKALVHVRDFLAASNVKHDEPRAPERGPAAAPQVASTGAYFGRKSFRVGDD